MKWTEADIPDQSGRLFVITGANSGIGWEAARMLAAHGAHIVMASRSEDKARAAIEKLSRRTSSAQVDFMQLDLASLDSIRSFAEAFHAGHDRLDVLINNAGVMALPRRETKDGFEMQMGTNHFGHFALTGLLLDLLLATDDSRIVTVSSGLHERGRMNFDDLMGEKNYDKWGQYGQSKLSNLLFAYELDRRLDGRALSAACHPGYAATNLQSAGPKMEGSVLNRIGMALANTLIAQSAAMGALPTAYAAVHPEVEGGDYIGPTGFGGYRGYPGKNRSSEASHNEQDAKRLWEISTNLTTVRYDAL